MAAHTQTLTKSDCLNHTEKDRILYEVSFVFLKTSTLKFSFSDKATKICAIVLMVLTFTK